MKKMFDAEFAKKFGLDKVVVSNTSDYTYDFNEAYYRGKTG